MRCKIIVFSIILILSNSAVSQEKKSSEKDTSDTGKKVETSNVSRGDHVYYEMTLEDFEETNYNKKNFKYYSEGEPEDEASILIRNQYPAPVKNSKKYLGVKLKGKKGYAIQIIPQKRLLIDKYCRAISIWVYGKKLAGELSIFLKDAKGNTHRIVFGTLTFHGWRKLTKKILPKVSQEDEYLNQKRHLEIIKLLYKPYTRSRLPIWHYFYIDDISAMVREKYVDKQSDDW